MPPATASKKKVHKPVRLSSDGNQANPYTEPNCHPRQTKQKNKNLNTLLKGFFDYWRQFDYVGSTPCVRLGAEQSRSEVGFDQAGAVAAEHVVAAAFAVEDPCEPGENTAQALSHWRL